MYIDRFVTAGYPAHAAAARERGRAGSGCCGRAKKILVEPGGFLYKDSTVQMQAVQMPLKTGLLRTAMYLAEMNRTRRVGIHPCTSITHAD